ncbi:hypothetical protein HK102_012488 [Quaeritorhiza haematococci]|nr:hypothetical protein HK102_012488 [Quaeritorhiza haematococci]
MLAPIVNGKTTTSGSSAALDVPGGKLGSRQGSASSIARGASNPTLSATPDSKRRRHVTEPTPIRVGGGNSGLAIMGNLSAKTLEPPLSASPSMPTLINGTPRRQGSRSLLSIKSNNPSAATSSGSIGVNTTRNAPPPAFELRGATLNPNNQVVDLLPPVDLRGLANTLKEQQQQQQQLQPRAGVVSARPPTKQLGKLGSSSNLLNRTGSQANMLLAGREVRERMNSYEELRKSVETLNTVSTTSNSKGPKSEDKPMWRPVGNMDAAGRELFLRNRERAKEVARQARMRLLAGNGDDTDSSSESISSGSDESERSGSGSLFRYDGENSTEQQQEAQQAQQKPTLGSNQQKVLPPISDSSMTGLAALDKLLTVEDDFARLDTRDTNVLENERSMMIRDLNIVPTKRVEKISQEDMLNMAWRFFRYIRSLKDDAISGDLADQIVQQMEEDDDESRLYGLKRIIAKLPRETFVVFKAFIGHLNRLSKSCEYDIMKGISSSFGPLILRRTLTLRESISWSEAFASRAQTARTGGATAGTRTEVIGPPEPRDQQVYSSLTNLNDDDSDSSSNSSTTDVTRSFVVPGFREDYPHRSQPPSIVSPISKPTTAKSMLKDGGTGTGGGLLEDEDSKDDGSEIDSQNRTPSIAGGSVVESLPPPRPIRGISKAPTSVVSFATKERLIDNSSPRISVAYTTGPEDFVNAFLEQRALNIESAALDLLIRNFDSLFAWNSFSLGGAGRLLS